MNAWLVKQEPGAYPFAQLVEDGGTRWDGVRNAQARIHLRAMKRGDTVLYYHSGDEKAVVGVAKVAKAGYPDPTAAEWVAVDLAPVKPLPFPVTLAAVKAEPALRNMGLVRQSRLSVMPVTAQELELILAMAQKGGKR